MQYDRCSSVGIANWRDELQRVAMFSFCWRVSTKSMFFLCEVCLVRSATCFDAAA